MSNLFLRRLNNIHQEQTLWPTMANGYDSLPYGRELCRPPFGLRWWETENKCYMYNKLPKYWIGFTLYLIPLDGCIMEWCHNYLYPTHHPSNFIFLSARLKFLNRIL